MSPLYTGKRSSSNEVLTNGVEVKYVHLINSILHTPSLPPSKSAHHLIKFPLEESFRFIVQNYKEIQPPQLVLQQYVQLPSTASRNEFFVANFKSPSGTYRRYLDLVPDNYILSPYVSSFLDKHVISMLNH